MFYSLFYAYARFDSRDRQFSTPAFLLWPNTGQKSKKIHKNYSFKFVMKNAFRLQNFCYTDIREEFNSYLQKF